MVTKQAFMDSVERLPLGRLWAFAIKQAWAALFGGLMLGALIFTAYVHLPWLPRYDWMFLFALAIQAFMLGAKLEKPHEVITIVLFHLTGLGMELFKTSGQIGSWIYPHDAFFMIGNVPLFSGFMYAAVGSYMARAWRVMQLNFAPYPHRWATVVLAVAIYVNFFTHHYIWDFRYAFFALVALLYGRTWTYYVINTTRRRMPLLLGFFLVACFIWVGENIGTYTGSWLYPSQYDGWHMVSLQKMGSWLLLIVMSFVMIDIVQSWRKKRSNIPVI